MKYFETPTFSGVFFYKKKKMSPQNTDNCLNSGYFTLNFVEH